MPQFLDHHPLAHAALTEEAVERVKAQILAEAPDDFGVKWLGAFAAINGDGYCLSRRQMRKPWSRRMKKRDT
jgi:hypothetical protein